MGWFPGVSPKLRILGCLRATMVPNLNALGVLFVVLPIDLLPVMRSLLGLTLSPFNCLRWTLISSLLSGSPRCSLFGTASAIPLRTAGFLKWINGLQSPHLSTMFQTSKLFLLESSLIREITKAVPISTSQCSKLISTQHIAWQTALQALT